MPSSTFGNILFGGGGGKKSKGSKYLEHKKRQERLRRAYAAGRPGVMEELPFLKSDKDPWKIERKARREEVSDSYWRERKMLHSKQKMAEKELERRLEKAREDLNRYYNWEDLPPGTERWERVKAMADKKYELLAGRMTREHEQEWKDNFNKLATGRNRQYQQLTKSMKKDVRRRHGMSEDLMRRIMGTGREAVLGGVEKDQEDKKIDGDKPGPHN